NMNWPNLQLPNGQQAPDHPPGSYPPCSVVRQAVRSEPTQIASKNSQLRICGTDQPRTSTASMVSTESVGVANRFFRSQAPMPTCERGAVSARSISVRTQ